ncbi:hypothetical protein HanRHA438_Chr01g0036151 [Helianthus annuus]|nr:hypothetical protein HanRHA438_Chr01g0036151 [Helianthus annuus]
MVIYMTNNHVNAVTMFVVGTTIMYRRTAIRNWSTLLALVVIIAPHVMLRISVLSLFRKCIRIFHFWKPVIVPYLYLIPNLVI